MIASRNRLLDRQMYGLLTFVAWLTIGGVVSTNRATAQSTAQQSAAEQSATVTSAPLTTAKVAAAIDQVSIERIESVVADLDTLFVKGDIRSYLNAFSPDQDGSLAVMGMHLEKLASISGKNRRRESKIIGDPINFAERTVVRIRHVTTWPTKRQQVQHVEDSYLAVKPTTKGGVVPTFAIEIAPTVGQLKNAKLHCPPYNFEIGGIDDYLCVPQQRERSLALESATFYLIGTDIACDLVVKAEDKPEKAKAVVQKLAGAFARLEPSARIGIPSSWTPPQHSQQPPYGMDSARIEVELPADHQESGGDISIFHAISFGGLQHVLLVRASKKSLDQHQSSVDKLLKSYMLLEVECRDRAIATNSLRQHTGGQIQGDSYYNKRFDLQLQGPKGWRAQDRVGGCMFRVRWSRDPMSEMWLIGHRVPAGMEKWTQATADRWLNHHRKKYHLTEATDEANAKESDWHQAADGSACRTLTLLQQRVADGHDHPISPNRRVLHMRLHDDLLVLVDGYGATKAEEAAVRAAVRTLKRTN